MMPRLNGDEIGSMLRRADACLSAPLSIVLIGGGAIAVAYLPNHGTRDIDATHLPRPFVEAWKTAGLPESLLDHAHVWDAPLNFEDRLQEIVLGTGRLRVFVPERHDLAMMKIVRGDDRDIEAISAVHSTVPLKLSRMEELYRSEMSHIISDMRKFRMNFLMACAALFGAVTARQIEKDLPIL